MTWTGSPPALVGFNAGDGASSFALPTSRTPAVLAVAEAGNTGSDGKWFFQVDGSDVQMPGMYVVVPIKMDSPHLKGTNDDLGQVGSG